MWRRALCRLTLAALFALAGLGSALAAECVLPGAIIDVPTPGYLKRERPNLFYDAGDGLARVTLLNYTTSRLVMRAPATGLVEKRPFKILHVGREDDVRTVATLKTCDSFERRSDATSQGRPPVIRATREDVMAPSGGPEYAIVGSKTAIARAESVVLSEGGTILRNKTLDGVGQSILFVDLNDKLTLDRLRAILDSRNIDVTADRHSVYDGAASPRVYAPALVGFDAAGGCRLRTPVRIGLIDGPVDTSNPALRGVLIETRSVLNPEERPGGRDHATAIAALIAAPGQGSDMRGIAPGAQLFSVIAFARAGGRDVARLENIAEGLDWLIQRRVGLVNLSLEGPDNSALGRVIGLAADKGMVMVAAAGNAGQPRVAYPAADTHVIAVTAVDAAKRIYRRASYGAEIDFAAPGVDILVPRRRGTGFESGTSFASAIATGLIAHETQSRAISADDIRRRLAARSEDLGEKGRDAHFGWGLMKASGCR